MLHNPDPAHIVDEIVLGFSMPQKFYVSDQIFQLEKVNIFMENWLLVGHESEVPNSGDYLLFTLLGESIIVTRNNAGNVNCFYNICRHRGSIICTEPSGNTRYFVCPYHSWSYGLDGKLIPPIGMGENFIGENYNLIEIKTEILNGLIFICLSDTPPDFSNISHTLTPFFEAQGIAKSKICKKITWDIEANWKLFVENHAECYHCASIHPEFFSIMPHAKARTDSSKEAHLDLEKRRTEWAENAKRLGNPSYRNFGKVGGVVAAGRVPLNKGIKSQSQDGKVVAPLMGTYTVSDEGALSTRIYPFSYVLGPCDYIVTLQFIPISGQKTKVILNWLVDEQAEESVDFDKDAVSWFWENTLRQDVEAVKLQQAGILSAKYAPGPLSPAEEYFKLFYTWYKNQLSGA